MSKKRKYTPQQLAIIRRKYAEQSQKSSDSIASSTGRERFPKSFPFWARLKIEKHRPTLVIDEEVAIDKKTKKPDEHFVHKEVTHTYKSNYDEIKPNPDKDDPDPMYLKRPRKLPQRLFEPFDKDWEVPDEQKKKYERNNKKQ